MISSMRAINEDLAKIVSDSEIINNPSVKYHEFVNQLLESVDDNKQDRIVYLDNLKSIKDWAMDKYDDEATPYAEKHYLYGVVKEVERLLMIVDV